MNTTFPLIRGALGRTGHAPSVHVQPTRSGCVTRGIRIGEGRSEALKKMSERSSSQEMASFVRAIIQADQLGISLGRILKVQAGDTRLKRQLLAEEKAMKAPIKMLFPTVIFIFPAMFLVVLGPAFLNLSALFKF